MSKELSDREKQYWKIRASLELLFRVSDQDIIKNPELAEFLDVYAKVVLLFHEQGPDKIFDQSRAQKLQELGVAILRPKRKE